MSIPKRVVKAGKETAVIEGGTIIKLGNLKILPGDYLLCYGNIAVEKINKKKAEAFRKILSTST